MPRFQPDPQTVYLGDNGRAYCGQHLGCTAKASGRDLSGQRLMAVTPEVAAIAAEDGWVPKCEQCGHEASLLVAVR